MTLAQQSAGDWKGVMIYAEYGPNGFEPVTYELISKASELAHKVGQEVAAVAIGSGITQAAGDLLFYPVHKVLVYDNPGLKYFTAPVYSRILEDAVLSQKPSVLLIGATPIGRSLAPRLAVRLRTGLTADCTSLDIRPNGELVQTRPAFGGNIMATIVTRKHRPQMATVRYKVMPAASRSNLPSGNILDMSSRLSELAPTLSRHLNVLRFFSMANATKSGSSSISEAKIIVACGRGVKSQKDLPLFQEFARKIGGVLGGSRPLVEKGWIPSTHQVGQSGRTVRPSLYIACGISGAIQHVAGMSGSEVIVAINNDPNAPIFEIANFGIVGDMYSIVPELLKLLPGEVT